MNLTLLALGLCSGADFGNGPVTPIATAQITPIVAASPTTQDVTFTVTHLDPTPFGRTGVLRIHGITTGPAAGLEQTLFITRDATIMLNGKAAASMDALAKAVDNKQGVTAVVTEAVDRYGLVLSVAFTVPTPVKSTKDPTPTQAVMPAGYPLRSASTWWTGCSNWVHLTTGVHAGKFPSAWLASLSPAQVQSLHSDDHENRVKWQYVPGSNRTETRAVLPRASTTPPVAEVQNVVEPVDSPLTYIVPAKTIVSGAGGCPGGVCPGQSTSRSRFRLLR